MRKSLSLSLLVAVFLVCFALTGCGGSGGGQSNAGGMPKEAMSQMRKSSDQKKPGGN